MVDKTLMSDGFSSEELAQLERIVERGVRKGFADAGLRIDDGASEDEARKDFAFIRAVRRTLGGWATSLGWLIILTVISALVWLVTQGLTFWKGQ
jgi:hypothetical protein